MNKIAQFHKVSFEQFEESWKDSFLGTSGEEIKAIYDGIKLPKRATRGSANTKTGRPSGVMSLATGTMSASETTNYRLRMYVDEDYNPQGDGGGLSFSVKINAYGKVKEAPTGSKMKAYMTQDDYDNDNYLVAEVKFCISSSSRPSTFTLFSILGIITE